MIEKIKITAAILFIGGLIVGPLILGIVGIISSQGRISEPNPVVMCGRDRMNGSPDEYCVDDNDRGETLAGRPIGRNFNEQLKFQRGEAAEDLGDAQTLTVFGALWLAIVLFPLRKIRRSDLKVFSARFSRSRKVPSGRSGSAPTPSLTQSQQILMELGEGEHGDKLQAELLVNETLKKLKPVAIEVSEERGAVLDERALYWANEFRWLIDSDRRFWERVASDTNWDRRGEPIRWTVGHCLTFKLRSESTRIIYLTINCAGRGELHGGLGSKVAATAEEFEKLLRGIL